MDSKIQTVQTQYFFSFSGELLGIEYLYSQTGKVLEDSMKAIEDLETSSEVETSTEGEDEDLLQGADQIDDLTVSIFGVNESSDIVLENPSMLPPTPLEVPSEPELSSSPSQQPETPSCTSTMDQQASPVSCSTSYLVKCTYM